MCFLLLFFPASFQAKTKPAQDAGFAETFSAADTPSSFPTGRTPFLLGRFGRCFFDAFGRFGGRFARGSFAHFAMGGFGGLARRFFGRGGTGRFACFFASGGFGGFIAFQSQRQHFVHMRHGNQRQLFAHFFGQLGHILFIGMREQNRLYALTVRSQEFFFRSAALFFSFSPPGPVSAGQATLSGRQGEGPCRESAPTGCGWGKAFLEVSSWDISLPPTFPGSNITLCPTLSLITFSAEIHRSGG